MPDVDPRRSLFILLGARVFPKYPNLTSGMVFARSADEILKYATDASGLGINERNVLDLFDDSSPAPNQLEEIRRFLREKQSLSSPSVNVENVFVYYLGHGLFTPIDTKYCLALRCTNTDAVDYTAMRGRDLAAVISTHASYLRRFLILDCCFAGSIVKEFQSAPGDVATLQMMDQLPKRGTCLVCASSFDNAALAPQALGMTMFSSAFLKALREGNPTLSESLSMVEIKDIVTSILQREHTNWVRPELHSPDMREGEISLLHLFPNPAWVRERIQREQSEAARKAEEERQARGAAEAWRKAEGERRAREAVEAARKAEEERQARQAAETAAKAEQKRRDQEAAAEAERERSRNRFQRFLYVTVSSAIVGGGMEMVLINAFLLIAVTPGWLFVVCAAASGLLTGIVYTLVLNKFLPNRLDAWALGSGWLLGWTVMARGVYPAVGILSALLTAAPVSARNWRVSRN